MRKQLHQSGLEMYNLCGERFRLRYVEGHKRPPSAYMICGSATDRAVNSDLDTKIVTGELLADDAVLDIARDAVENHPEAKEIALLDEDEKGKSLEQVLGETKDKAVRLVGKHHSTAAPILHPWRTARKFSVNLDKFLRTRATQTHEEAELSEGWKRRVLHAQAAALNAAARDGYDLVGEQDLLEGEKTDEGTLDVTRPLIVRDLKTSKKSPTATIADESDQLTIYSIASLVIDGKLPERVVLDYLVDLKREVKYVPVISHRTNADVAVALNRAANAIAGIGLGNFVPIPQTHWACDPRYCGFTEICRYYKQPKSVTVPTELSGSADDSKPKLVQIAEVAK